MWIPAALITGITFYVSLSFEPSIFMYFLVLGVFLTGAYGVIYHRHTLSRFLGWFFIWSSTGFFITVLYSHLKAKPLLQTEVGPVWIEGTVQSCEHKTSSKQLYQRIILSNITAEGYNLQKIPYTARLSIRTQSPHLNNRDRIKLRAKFLPFQPAALPGGYDARLQNFFQGIQTYGFSITSVTRLKEGKTFFSKLRNHITRQFYEKLPQPLASVACALVTGDKAGLPGEIQKDFSVSGLSHVLAISGLHLAILWNLVFFTFRELLGSIPHLPLYVNLHKISSLLALAAGGAYLHISGMGYPALRSFFMMSCGVLGSFLARRPQSLRILALCATFFLLLEPGCIFSLSFQLSFLATAGLISLHYRQSMHKTSLGTIKEFILGSSIVTLATTFATLPSIAYHFHQISLQSVIANLLAVSLTSYLVIPLGVISLLFMHSPFSSFFFTMWGYSLKSLISIAAYCTKYMGFLFFHILPYSAFFLVVQIICIFWVLLWQKTWRLTAVPVFALSFMASLLFPIKPDILIHPAHPLVACPAYQDGILWVSSARRGKFLSKMWANAFDLPFIYGVEKKTPLTSSVPPFLFKKDPNRLGWSLYDAHNTLVPLNYPPTAMAYCWHKRKLVVLWSGQLGRPWSPLPCIEQS